MDPNDLIFLKSTRAGLDRPLAIQAVRWFGAGAEARVRVTWTSKVLPIFIPEAMPGGTNARVEAGGKLVVAQRADLRTIKLLREKCHDAGIPTILGPGTSGG